MIRNYTKYYTELYFYENENKGLTDVPNLDEYSKSTVAYEVSAEKWKDAKQIIISQYPNVAYIHIIESKSMSNMM